MLNLFLNLFSIFTSFPGTPFSHLFPINLFCPKHLQSLFFMCNEILQRRDMPYVFFIIYRKIYPHLLTIKLVLHLTPNA